jgi:sugar O-acyltransferase (sialic acid O-acetyltransferase NeuD family)
MRNKTKLVIYGAGGQGRVLLRLARDINRVENRWDEILFADDVLSERNVMGHRVYPLTLITKTFEVECLEFVISLGDPVFRKFLFEKVEEIGGHFGAPLLPNNEDLLYSNFGKGSIISNNVLIPNNANVGENVYIANAASIGHDTIIEKHSFVACHAVIGGGCSIGEGSFIGLNATLRDHIKIGSNVIVSMGACVFNDLPNGAKVIGNPAQRVLNLEGSKLYRSSVERNSSTPTEMS